MKNTFPLVKTFFLSSLITLCVGPGFNAYAMPEKPIEKDSVAMVKIPAGNFLMGSRSGEGRADERVQRSVYLDAYAIDVHEVSNQRYLKFIQDTQRKEPLNPYSDGLLSEEAGVENLPIVQVTWYDAVDYCRWAGKRLPTEAEWEKAARGSSGSIYPWGKAEPAAELVNFHRNWDGVRTLWKTGSSPESASPFQVHDMAGNVREWVNDWYSADYYLSGPDKNPQGPEQGILKVIKGGSWHSLKSDLRTASRGKGGFALKTDGIGFRCARDPD
ncbi:MAG: formylglycine-generating enzyme family protein [Candidatus Nitrohelix vancouverensis]|uniref:Formylglycine-generating enzyme family protein n=1 Tax=Candidatus Nitrohelix vancouverensis TaxID=2705534 RepID=A0A7T0G3R7_9BACT|nr:MAG: formylglycine-generating enzyme family protein [Candidatus Nitrohelix vancouverensis]